jgi:hypothetical protein
MGLSMGSGPAAALGQKFQIDPRGLGRDGVQKVAVNSTNDADTRNAGARVSTLLTGNSSFSAE